MSQYKPCLILTVVAAGAIGGHRFVNFADAQADKGDAALGVTQFGASAAGKACEVVTLGTAVVEAGGAFDKGARLASDADGKAAAPVAASGDIINAIALEESTGDGDLVEVLLVSPVTAA
jgi:hypothetical protein